MANTNGNRLTLAWVAERYVVNACEHYQSVVCLFSFATRPLSRETGSGPPVRDFLLFFTEIVESQQARLHRPIDL